MSQRDREFARRGHRLSKCAAPPFHIEDQCTRAESELLGHDRTDNERQRWHRCGHIAESVEGPVGGSNVISLGDNGRAAGVDQIKRFTAAAVRVPTRQGVKLVEGSLRVAKATTRHHRHRYADRGQNWRQHQRNRVSDTAGGVFVHNLRPIARKIPHLTGVQHFLGQPTGFVRAHAAAANGHEHCSQLFRRQ